MVWRFACAARLLLLALGLWIGLDLLHVRVDAHLMAFAECDRDYAVVEILVNSLCVFS